MSDDGRLGFWGSEDWRTPLIIQFDAIISKAETNPSRVKATDSVLGVLDDLLLAFRYAEASQFIRALAESKLPLAVLMSVLALSHSWGKHFGGAKEVLEQRVESLMKAQT